MSCFGGKSLIPSLIEARIFGFFHYGTTAQGHIHEGLEDEPKMVLHL